MLSKSNQYRIGLKIISGNFLQISSKSLKAEWWIFNGNLTPELIYRLADGCCWRSRRLWPEINSALKMPKTLWDCFIRR